MFEKRAWEYKEGKEEHSFAWLVGGLESSHDRVLCAKWLHTYVVVVEEWILGGWDAMCMCNDEIQRNERDFLFTLTS